MCLVKLSAANPVQSNYTTWWPRLQQKIINKTRQDKTKQNKTTAKEEVAVLRAKVAICNCMDRKLKKTRLNSYPSTWISHQGNKCHFLRREARALKRGSGEVFSV